MLKPAGVLFDFDGVVVDSLSVHLIAWANAYKILYGLELTDTVGLPGRSTGAIADILSSRAGKPATASSLADEKRAQLKISRNLIKAMPGALEAFRWLEQEGVPFGIASNAPRAFIENTLDALNAKVKYIFGVDDVARPKPEPDMFLLCAKAAGIKFQDHHRTIVFEDSLHGLQAAVKAGMYPIGVTTQHSHHELLGGGAKLACLHIQDAMDKGWFHAL